MLAMMPRLLAHRPTVAMSLSCIACSCARVKKYDASSMPPRSRATAPETLSARTSRVRSPSMRARSCATMAHCWPRSSRPSRLCAMPHSSVSVGACSSSSCEHPLGRRPLTVGHQQRRDDARILGLIGRIGHADAEVPNLVQLAPRQLQLAAGHVDLRPPPEREGPQRVIPRRLGFGDRPVGLREGAVERALLPVGDPEVVVALANTLPPAGPLEGGAGDLPGSDRLGVSSPQVTDDAEVVGAAADGRRIAVQAGEHEGPRAVVRGLVETPADQRHGAPCVQCTTLDSPLPALARLLQRRIQPAEPLSVAPDARLRGPVQQRETRGLYELTALAGGEIV